MVDPISSERLMPIGSPRPSGATPKSDPVTTETDFAQQLRQQLERVSQMQAEAQEGIQDLITGQSDNIAGVFTTARKAEVAFSLLMEIRNKLVEAYSELRQLRV
jgi:flagellar hook-basal body complex protein FliE